MKSVFLLLLSALSIHAAKPNIVFILADDLGYGDLSCYGQKNFKTPVLDRLAAEGLRFTDHYSGATVCAPSRACLMAGKDTGHVAIRGNGAFNLPETETTVATLLKQSGYQTAMIGKSSVTGNTQDAHWPAKQGFDYFYGTTSHVDAHFRYPRFVYENSKRIDLPENQLHFGSDYDLTLYTEKATSWLGKQSKDSPFFLLLSIPVPHASIILPEEKVTGSPHHYKKVADPKASYIGLMKRVDETGGRNGWTKRVDETGGRNGWTKRVDETVGEVIAELEKRDLRNDTLILFSSDNGPHQEGGYKPGLNQSAGPLRGLKRDLYEGDIRVPMIANWPATIKPGRTTPHPSAFWDFLPTVCDILSISPPDETQGISYLPTLKGVGTQKAHDSLYWESFESGGRRALREGHWKIVHYQVTKQPDGPFQLYDLSKDPGETNDLASEQPNIVNRLAEKMDAGRTPCPMFPYPPLDHQDP